MSSRILSSSFMPETGIIRYIISSCLSKSAIILDAHRASTSGATSIMREPAEESGDRRWVATISLYACS